MQRNQPLQRGLQKQEKEKDAQHQPRNKPVPEMLCNVINGSNIDNNTMQSLNGMNDSCIFSLLPHPSII